MVAAQILIAEDDTGVRDAVRRALRFEGYEVSVAVDGEEAVDLVTKQRPDALVLDVMMPKMDGLDVCRHLRAQGDDLPILILTARHEVSDRVAGLDAGADDYLVKPFALEELLARLRALLRRNLADDDGSGGRLLRVADLSLDPASREVRRGERRIDLTRTEFSLLELLLRNSGVVLTREVILDRVWGYDFDTSSNSLDVYIGYLRRKTEADGEARLIQTVRGVGYVARDT